MEGGEFNGIRTEKTELENIIIRSVPSKYPEKEIKEMAKAVAAAISENNKQLEKELDNKI